VPHASIFSSQAPARDDEYLAALEAAVQAAEDVGVAAAAAREWMEQLRDDEVRAEPSLRPLPRPLSILI